MKKTLTALLFIMLSLSSFAEIAHGTCGEKLTWSLSDDYTLTIDGEGKMKDWVYNSYAPWYSYQSQIIKLSIGERVTSIGDYAFYYCSKLTSVTIPNSVTSIGEAAFSRCSGLTSLTIPNSVTSIGNEAFFGCSGLTSVTVEDGNQNYCSEDNVVYTKDKSTLIYYMTSKKGYFVIPNSVTSIGEYAFSGCSGLTSVTIPNSVTSIGYSAFYSCSGLTSVTIPNSVTSIGNDAFYGCSSLTSVTIPNSVTRIGEWAFCKCSGLTSLTIPNSVTSIGDGAFSGCFSLTSVTIGSSVTSIGDYAFSVCGNVKELIYAEGTETVIRTYLTSITSVTIPNSVTSIGSSAFYNCSGLTSVTIPNSVTSIEDGAFSNCSGLTSLTIPNSVTSIGNYAFEYCSRLREVHSNNITPPKCGQNTFNGVQTANCRLYVPTGSKEDYAFAIGWGNFVNIIEESVINPTDEIEVPTISYDNQKLVFDCGTPDVTYSYTIKAEDNTSSLTDSENGEIDLSATYVITAYAKKDKKTSEPATATLHWMNGTMDTATGTQEFGAKRAILVSSNDGFVNVSGLSDGEKVEVYSTDGKLLNTTYAAGNAANIAAKVGDTIILKINGETIKVLVK